MDGKLTRGYIPWNRTDHLVYLAIPFDVEGRVTEQIGCIPSKGAVHDGGFLGSCGLADKVTDLIVVDFFDFVADGPLVAILET